MGASAADHSMIRCPTQADAEGLRCDSAWGGAALTYVDGCYDTAESLVTCNANLAQGDGERVNAVYGREFAEGHLVGSVDGQVGEAGSEAD